MRRTSVKNICSELSISFQQPVEKEGGTDTRNRIIPNDHLDRIMRCADEEYKTIFKLLIETGFRLNDMLSIRQYQAKKALKSGILTISESKTGKQRSVKMSSEALRAVQRQFEGCLVYKHPFAYFFPSRTSREAQKRKKLHRSTVQRNFAIAVKRAGLEGNGYTVHSLRHVYARSIYEKTGSVLSVMRDLKHDRISTTLLYVCDLTL